MFTLKIALGQSENPYKPQSISSRDNLYFDHLNNIDLNKRLQPRSNTKRLKESTFKSDCEYSSNHEIALLNTSELVQFLKSTYDYNCHARKLFDFDEEASSIIFTQENILAVIQELERLAPTYNGSFENGIYGLLIYIHVALYFDFYYPSTVNFSLEANQAFQKASDLMCQNPHLFDLNSEASEILDEFLITIDTKGIRERPLTIELIKQVMRNMTINNTWLDAPELDWVIPYWQIFYLMFRGSADDNYMDAISKDDEFINLLGGIAVDTLIMQNEDLEGIWQYNAIVELSHLVKIESFKDRTSFYLNSVCDLFPRLHRNWVTAIFALNEAEKCVEYNKCISEEKIIEELTQFLFPNTYSYNDSSFILNAKMDTLIAHTLYYASEQTKAQLFRLMQTDQAIDGDPNKQLKAFVFESYKAYEDFAPLLYDISTDNGGMYIEQRGAFYTWDRPSTYSLSIEELFRHEYIHYLQGRFLIPGMWGENPFYENDRLTWYGEGMAELISGSTDFEGIKLKRYTANRIKNDYPNFPSLADVLGSYYGQAGSIYYRYGNLLWHYWYLYDYGVIKTLMDLTRANDISGFDTYIDELKSNTKLESDWQSYLLDVRNEVIPSWEVSTRWLDDKFLSVKYIDDIKNEFVAISGDSLIDVILDASNSIQRFKIIGTLEREESVSSNAEAALLMNQSLDSLLVQLKSDQYINNFDYTVGYLTDISFNNNIPTATFHIMGSLCDSSINTDPIGDFSVSKTYLISGDSTSIASKSTGYIKGLLWDFNGGISNDTIIPNPTVRYSEPGLFDISLTTFGREESKYHTKTYSNIIKVFKQSRSDYCIPSYDYDYTWINKFSIGNFSNESSGFQNQGYSDYSSNHVIELIKDSTYNFSINLSYTNAPNIRIRVWADLNHDGSFSASGEKLLDEKPQILTQLTDIPVRIPTTAKNGITRLRVRATYTTNAINECDADYYTGEVEDYSIAILDNSWDMTVPSPPTEFSLLSVSDTSFSIEWNLPYSNLGIIAYDVYLNNEYKVTESRNKISFNKLTANTEYTLLIKAIDALERTSVQSQVVMIKTKEAPYISISTDTLHLVPENAYSSSFEIQSNQDWIVEKEDSWIILSDTIGNGNSNLTVNAIPNSTIEDRSAVIYIISMNKDTLKLNVKQPALITGIDDLIYSYDSEIFPNPTSGEFTLSIDNEYHGMLSIKLIDLNGRELLFEKDYKLTSNYQKTFKINCISKGVSYLMIRFNSKTEIIPILIQ